MENLASESFFGHAALALAFSLVVNILCAILRKAAESASPRVKASGAWRELWLPIMPIALGAVLAMSMSSFPYPGQFGSSLAMRAVYGILAGFFSTWAYRIVKTIVQRKWDVQLPDLATRHSSSPPPEELPFVGESESDSD